MPSEYLLLVGFASIVWSKKKRETGTLVNDAPEYFERLFRESVRLHLTAPGRYREQPRALIASFAAMHTVFGEQWHEAAQEAIQYLRHSTLSLSAAACFAWKDGVGLPELEIAFGNYGINLRQTLQAFEGEMADTCESWVARDVLELKSALSTEMNTQPEEG